MLCIYVSGDKKCCVQDVAGQPAEKIIGSNGQEFRLLTPNRFALVVGLIRVKSKSGTITLDDIDRITALESAVQSLPDWQAYYEAAGLRMPAPDCAIKGMIGENNGY